MKKAALSLIGLLSMLMVYAQKNKQGAKKRAIATATAKQILPGAYQINDYLPLLKGKRVGIFANNTATINNTHLVDTLKKLGITITKIFGPEHGFRGNANAGSHIDNYTDEKTGIPVISLYGAKRKPSEEDLANVDILVFDIQDVGVRFYTYISSLQEFMESAMEFDKPLVILDRPNPNGFYIDGPVLDTTFKSFIGMQPVPVVYGMTIGEYANFLVGEGLLDKNIMASWMMRIVNNASETGKGKGNGLNITVIKCRNYTHKSKYILPIKPSPNLPDAGSLYWYPSTCFFEGTALNEGRGTNKPFQIFGHPSLPKNLYAFTPVANAGSSSPKLKDKLCYGWNLSGPIEQILQQVDNRIQLKYLLNAYKLFPDKQNFFIKANKANPKPADYFFNKLAGNAELMQQIIDGKSENEIRASWQPKLEVFKKKRKKYLMYADFDSR
ncbi:DUF1343 domain-containing protein [Segetibacter sp.]|jgi:uncharacterized protein YbbC (DUF1343 family)|uniref:exo-beta-N-acetylmuramidase NamZ family protein n=1 Tax=Segetibacter sp. TaxID=2231182 RepID=UPI00261F65A3|nr:DUF1343 domain-containing protein [Segetibacter sp.]MCW3079253.1 hypothetical protein [Segetibacter sp.]